MAEFPALEVSFADLDRLLAIVDDSALTAVEEHPGSLTLYFTDAAARDRARHAIARELPLVASSPREVDDENWAQQSQAAVTSITVGRITVSPPWLVPSTTGSGSGITVAIAPSMGFGTGHHPTTRLCLRALQTLNLFGRSVLDVGTGSGVLAIAARLLGAREAMGLDSDADAVTSARENLALNPTADCVRFEVGSLSTAEVPQADVVVANLTGALLVRSAVRLVDLVYPGGTLVLGGLMTDEQPEVLQAFAWARAPERPGHPMWVVEEDGWMGLAINFDPI